jgi:hypothetical protein
MFTTRLCFDMITERDLKILTERKKKLGETLQSVEGFYFLKPEKFKTG